MKRNTLFHSMAVVLTLTFFNCPLWAWKWGDPIKKVFKDGSKDIERGVQNLGKAGADLVTLGEEGRRRDRQRADHQKELAEAENLRTEQAKNEAIQRIEIHITYKKQLITLSEQTNKLLLNLHTNLKRNLDHLQDIISTLGIQSSEFETQQAIIELQFADLTDWLKQMENYSDQSDPSLKPFYALLNKNLQQKVTLYLEELKHLPRSDHGRVEPALFDRALLTGFEAIESVNSEIKNIQENLQTLNTSLESFQKEFEQLSK